MVLSELQVCAMESKAKSKAMTAILQRMNANSDYNIVFFGDEVIIEQPVEKWPLCQVW